MTQYGNRLEKLQIASKLWRPAGALFVTAGLLAGFLLDDKIEPKYIEDVVSTPSDEAADVTNKTENEHNEWEQMYRTAYEGLSIPADTPLKEYIPQRGEYWISILQAKYGVDDVTAHKMANKIKEMIYGDSRAAKQSPVMYLPETWTFEGKTYTYNDSIDAAKTNDFTDEVKTEMGKMGKDLKY